MVGWHRQLNGHEFGWIPGVGYGQGGLACCSSWGHKESEMTEWLNWTELKKRWDYQSHDKITTKYTEKEKFASLHQSKNINESESESEVVQSCPTLCNPMDCSLPGSSVSGILQARILEWVAMSSSKGSSWPRIQAYVSCITGGFFITKSPGKPLENSSYDQ